MNFAAPWPWMWTKYIMLRSLLNLLRCHWTISGMIYEANWDTHSQDHGQSSIRSNVMASKDRQELLKLSIPFRYYSFSGFFNCAFNLVVARLVPRSQFETELRLPWTQDTTFLTEISAGASIASINDDGMHANFYIYSFQYTPIQLMLLLELDMQSHIYLTSCNPIRDSLFQFRFADEYYIVCRTIQTETGGLQMVWCEML